MAHPTVTANDGSALGSRRAGLQARRSLLLGLAFTLALVGPARSQSLEDFEKRTTVHTLENGWTFVIVERADTTPVFAFATQADVGSAQEVPGITGLAHMFEHMAFKGTPNIGTTDYEEENVAIEEMERAYQAYQTARLARDPDKADVEALRKTFEEKQAAAAQYVVPNEFGEIIEREGGVGLNAGTGADSTVYFYSLPANKVELFAYLESERFRRPVFREFYKERDVVMEERRLRTDSQPIGRLVEKFVGAAFSAHPYHHPVVGYMSDLQSFTLSDARAFYEEHYTPANLVTAIVGNIEAQDVIPILDRYFGRIPAGPKPRPLRTLEPEQTAEVVVTLRDPSQPFYLEGYHKPAGTHPDEPVYDAIADVLGRGRTSRLYKSLVRDQQVAVSAQAFGGFPGSKYPNLFTFYIVAAVGVPNEKVQAALRAEIERITTEAVTDEELQRFKTRARADLIRSLSSNSGLAGQLVAYQTLFGDWREMFRYLDRIDAVTKADIRRVAEATFRGTNRTVGHIVTETAAAQPGAETKDETAAKDGPKR